MSGLASLLLLAGAGRTANPAPTSDSSVPPVLEVTQSPEASQSAEASRIAAPTATASLAVDTAKIAKKYFTALASNDEETMRELQELAAPKSLAAAYVLHLATAAAADLDGGLSGCTRRCSMA